MSALVLEGPMEYKGTAVHRVGAVLNDTSNSLADRFRALFTLRGLGTPEAIKQICMCFSDQSSLLKHELAYCLGQIQDPIALPTLVRVLEDKAEDPMVRHEAGEAMGAIGDHSSASVLARYTNDDTPEVAETCQLALARLNWLSDQDGGQFRDNNPYQSIDPAPSLNEGDVDEWKREMMDSSKPLFLRYRALFALRNHGGEEAVRGIVCGFQDSSALFKHEVAYILGQMQHSSAVSGLEKKLRETDENPMVRHECAEALGAIASDKCVDLLRDFCEDHELVVRESCEVALDMLAYEREEEFQYANTVGKVSPQD